MQHPLDEVVKELCGVCRGSPLGRGTGFWVGRKREVLHQTLYHFPFPDTWKLGCRQPGLHLNALALCCLWIAACGEVSVGQTQHSYRDTILTSSSSEKKKNVNVISQYAVWVERRIDAIRGYLTVFSVHFYVMEIRTSPPVNFILSQSHRAHLHHLHSKTPPNTNWALRTNSCTITWQTDLFKRMLMCFFPNIN